MNTVLGQPKLLDESRMVTQCSYIGSHAIILASLLSVSLNLLSARQKEKKAESSKTRHSSNRDFSPKQGGGQQPAGKRSFKETASLPSMKAILFAGCKVGRGCSTCSSSGISQASEEAPSCSCWDCTATRLARSCQPTSEQAAAYQACHSPRALLDSCPLMDYFCLCKLG